jgi:hypothetical protein
VAMTKLVGVGLLLIVLAVGWIAADALVFKTGTDRPLRIAAGSHELCEFPLPDRSVGGKYGFTEFDLVLVRPEQPPLELEYEVHNAPWGDEIEVNFIDQDPIVARVEVYLPDDPTLVGEATLTVTGVVVAPMVMQDKPGFFSEVERQVNVSRALQVTGSVVSVRWPRWLRAGMIVLGVLLIIVGLAALVLDHQKTMKAATKRR